MSGTTAYRHEPHPTKNRHEKKKTKTTIVGPNENPSDVPGLVVIQPVSELFSNAVDYRNYLLIKKSAWDDHDLANKLSKMTRNIAVQMKNRIFI